MRLLVTGGAGFIGSNFVYYWRENHPDWQIRVLDALTYAGNLENLRPILSEIEFIKGNICNSGAVRKATKDVDVLVNFAAESHVDRSRYTPEKFHQTNVEGTRILLETAKKEGIKRFHHISTDEVYGALPLESKERFSETTPYNPNPENPYAVSKAEADHLVRKLHKETGLPITISNCSNNFGRFQFPEKFIPLSITNLIDGLKIPLYGDGLYTRDWIEVKDHCRAIDLILEKGKEGETYCIGANCEIPNIKVAKMILRLMGKDEGWFHHVPDRPAHDRRYAIDATKIREELEWKPIVTRENFESALGKTIQWYREHEGWWRPLLEREEPLLDKEGKRIGTIVVNRELGGVKIILENEVKKEKERRG